MLNSLSLEAKTCTACGETKLVTDFRKWSRVCKNCIKIKKRLYSKNYYHQHKDDATLKAKTAERRRLRKQADRKQHLQKKHEAYLRHKEWYNSNWHARRAIAAGATEIDRTITISKLLERDNYTCGICGLFIDQHATRHSDKPSIDHILPLCRGGQHTWNNVRATHCGCNNSRKSRADGTYCVKTHFLQAASSAKNQT